MTPTRRDLTFLLVLCAVLFLPALGARDLWHPNEPTYGQAVVEMEQRGDWLVPWVNGRPFAEKPILYYWMALLVSGAAGVNEWSLRAPTAAAGFLAVLGVWLLVLPYAGSRQARTAAALMATEFLVFWSARSIQMDIFVGAATLGVLVPVSRVWDHGANPWKGWTLAGVAAGLGFLAKGPVAWICPGLALGVYAVVSGRVREVVRSPLWAGAAACLAVAAPWYLLLWSSGRHDVLWEVLIRQNFTRFVEAWDHPQPWWYYAKYFWIDYAPWAPLVLLALGLGRRSHGERNLHRLAWSLLLGVMAFFSLSDSKRSPYVFPIAASVAILGAAVVTRFAEGRLDPLRRRLFLAGAAVWGSVFVASGGALFVLGAARVPEMAGAARATGSAAALAGLLLAAAPFFRAGRSALPRIALGAVMAVYLSASIWALPAADAVKSARGLGTALASAAAPEDRLMAYGVWRWRANYAYYARRPIPPVDSLEEVREAWRGDASVWVLVEDDHLAALRGVVGDTPPALQDRVGATGVYVFTNRAGDGQGG